MTPALHVGGDLTPLNFVEAAEAVDGGLTGTEGDDAAYADALQRQATGLVAQACSQASLVGTLAAQENARQIGFIRTLWGDALDLFFTLKAVSRCAAEWYIEESNREIESGARDNDPRLWPLANLNARMARTAFEVHTLTTAGFPRGALARARSMYELAITSRVLADHGAPDGLHPDLALRYSKMQDVERYADARHYNLAAPEESRFSDADMLRWRAESEAATREFGTELAKPRGWARPLFPNKRGQTIQIPDLEELAGFTSSRSFYRWANHEVHATARGGVLNTYVDDDGRYVHSTGRSHRGLGEPLSMAATYVAQALLDLLTDTGAEYTTTTNLTLKTIQGLKERVDEAVLSASAVANGTPYLT